MISDFISLIYTMTSSFAHVPQGSIPYTQHFHTRKPGFGEIRLDANGSAVYPNLVNYINSKFIVLTNELRQQTVTIQTTVASGQTPTAANVVSGLVHALAGAVTAPAAFAIADLKAAFKNQFARDAKVGDGWYLTTINSTASPFGYRDSAGTAFTTIAGNNNTIAIYFDTELTYKIYIVSDYTP